MLIAPVAVEWLAEASPKLQTTSASSGQSMRRVELAGAADGEGHPEGARQVGGDRGGLRDDREGVVAEDLVPAAGDGFVGRRQQPPEHVVDAVVAGDLGGPGQVEPAAAVVEQRRVRRPEGSGDGGVPLVAGGSDRVEAVALGPQPAGREVEVAAARLGIEQGQRPLGGQRRAEADRCRGVHHRLVPTPARRRGERARRAAPPRPDPGRRARRRPGCPGSQLQTPSPVQRGMRRTAEVRRRRRGRGACPRRAA